MSVVFIHEINTSHPLAPKLVWPGKWEAKDSLVLQHISRATPSTLAKIPLEKIRSVPDVWAFPRLIHEAWQKAEHELHETAIDRWRRLITILALSKWQKLRAELHSFELAGGNRSNYGAGFLSTAHEQWPDQVISLQPSSRAVTAFIMDNELLGLASDTMLIIPSPNPIPILPKSLAWLKEDVKAPIYSARSSLPEKANGHQLAALAKFLERSHKEVVELLKEAPPLAPPLTPLRNELKTFLNDVLNLTHQTNLNIGSSQWDEAAKVFVGPEGTPPKSPLRVFKYLPSRESADTQTQLRGRTDRVRAPNAILISNRLRDTREPGIPIPGNELVVWEQETLGDLDENQNTHELETKLAAQGRLLVKSRDIFQDSLIILANDTYEAHGDCKNYLIPLTPLALLFYTPQEILDRISIKQSDDVVSVSLRVTLGSEEDGYEFTETREYSRSKQCVESPLMTTLAIWPGFSADDWHHYFVHESWSEKSVVVERAVSAETLASAVRTQRDTSTTTAATSLKNANAQQMLHGIRRADLEHRNHKRIQLTSPKERALNRELLYRTSLPEAFECTIRDQSGHPVGSHRGLLFLEPKPTLHISSSRKWTLGVDFGTTNTFLAYNDDVTRPENAKPLVLSSQVRLPPHPQYEDPQDRNRGETEELTAQLYETLSEFIPAALAIEPPFLSLLHTRESVSADDVPVLAANRIEFIDNVSNSVRRISRPTEHQRFDFGLKWQPEGTDLVRRFFHQLVLQVAAEARLNGVKPENIHWRVTYPSSLPQTIETVFKKNVEQTIGAVTGEKGEALGEKIDFLFESSAAYKYAIHHERQPIFATHIIVDVGGHSSDVAVFGQHGSLWEGSLELGGQHILTDYWVGRRRELEELVNTFAVSTGGQNLFGDVVRPECAKQAVEILLNHAGFRDDLWTPDSPNSEPPLMTDTRLRARLALLGILDYILFVLSVLRQSGINLPESKASIFLCGRGSQIFQRFCQDELTWNTLNDAFVATGFARGCDRLTFSSKPKAEVAVGAAAFGVGVARQSNGEPSGEKRILPSGVSAEDHSGPTIRETAPREPFYIEDGPKEIIRHDNLREFCGRYKSLFEDYLDLTAVTDRDDVDGIVRRLLHQAWDMTDRSRSWTPPGQKPQLQPPFIFGLRAILEEWDKFRQNQK